MKKGMKKTLRAALVCIIILSVICGIIYPAIVTFASQLCFNNKANGSIVTVKLKDGSEVSYGSKLIAQEFTEPKYLIGRPSNDNGPSNLSPVGKEQDKLVEERIKWWHEFDPENKADIPMDLVTVSGSGVDPNISKDAAEYQVKRIAKARGISEEDVRKAIIKHTEGRTFGILGESRVNVLMVNLELDKLI